MGHSEVHQEDFEINIILNGAKKTVKVQPGETTDGAAYFKCSLTNKNITQIRQEKDGSWEQIWGDLENEMVQSIGKAISGHSR